MKIDVLSNQRAFLSLTVFVSFGLFLFLFSTDSKYSSFYVTPNIADNNRANSESNLRSKNAIIRQNVYLVNTSQCQIIKWPTFDDQTRPLFINRTLDAIQCNYGKSDGISIERFNFSGVQVINHLNESIDCFKREIQRNLGTDDRIHYMPPIRFMSEMIQYFPANTSLVNIVCFINKGDKKIYEKVIPLIPELKGQTYDTDNQLPNILFVGIDSVSRLNFDRHFPLSAKLISKHEFYTMYGYNKVADNTFVNLTPLLTGHYLEDIWNETISKSVFLNYFPFIWKDYHDRDYKTLLMEDAPDMGTFNYLKRGFDKPPTDYYLRPFNLAIEKNVKDNCYLGQIEMEVYYEYVYDFIRAMDKRKQKYLAFTFFARLTHDYLNNAGYADPLVARLLNRLFDENLMTNTVIIFFSDHGIRYGSIRETLSGKVEERMPFMHLYVPNKWHNIYLAINENRLTTPFDIHATLRHIIEGKPDLSLRYGKSLLVEIPEGRSCKSIPILEHWCSCQKSEPIVNLTKVEPISKFIVNKVNEMVTKDFGTECAELTLDRTLSAFEQHLSQKVLKFESSENDVIGRHVIYNKGSVETEEHFLVTLRVRPNNAVFEATVLFNELSKNMQIVGEVSRINAYGNQSDCIDNQFIRRYCFCKKYFFY